MPIGDKSAMRVKLAEITEQLPLRWALPFVAVVYGIGFYGFSQVCTLANEECSGGTPVLLFLNNALRSFGLFFAAPEIGGGGIHNWWLMTARWIAPLITVFALSRAFSTRIFEKWQQRKALQSKQHIVVLGNAEAARGLLPKDRRVVALAPEPLVGLGDVDLISVVGPADQPQRAGVAKAKHILILGDDDVENLAVHHAVAPLAGEHAHVALRISSPVLAARLSAENQFMKTPQGAEVTVVNVEQLLAKRFVHNENLNEAADLRGLSQAHLAVVGWTGFAEAAVENFVRLSPYRNLGIPLISIFCENSAAAKAKLFARLAALADGDFASLKFYEAFDLPSHAQISAVEKLGAVTTILVCDKADDVAATMAFGLRKATQTLDAWQAPLYVRLEKLALIGEMLKTDYANAADPAAQIIPVGHGELSLLPQDVFGGNDDLARAFHAAYLSDNKASGPAQKPWRELPQTYRNANRAVAEQAWPRVHSSGYRAMSNAGSWSIDQHPLKFEALAEIIHRMWVIDRRLDGWRYGKLRDNKRKLHPDLCVYDKLSEGVKELDRAQIKVEQQVFSKNSVTVWPEVTVAVVAKNISAMPQGFVESLSGKFVTLVSTFSHEAETKMVEDLAKALKPNARIFALGANETPRHLKILHINGNAQMWIAKRADVILSDGAYTFKTKAKIWEMKQ